MERTGPRLPIEIADRFTQPFARFLKIEAATGAILILAVGIALFLSNSAWSAAAFSGFWETNGKTAVTSAKSIILAKGLS